MKKIVPGSMAFFLLLGLAFSALAQKTGEDFVTLLDLVELEAEESRAKYAAFEAAGHSTDLESMQAELITARRAAQAIEDNLHRRLAAWGSTRREHHRLAGLTGHWARSAYAVHQSFDHSMKTLHAELRVLRDLHLLQQRRDQQLMEVGKSIVARAQLQATYRAAAESRAIVVSRAQQAQESTTLKHVDESLKRSLSRTLVNDTVEDFHRYKGTLFRPVASPPTYRYGPRMTSSKIEERHTGWTWETPVGTSVRSTAAGLVIYAGRFRGFGNLVVVDHGNGYHSLYAHLSEIDVQTAQRIVRGQEIGKSGETGSFHGPRLYFEFRHRGEPVDPADWFVQTP